MNSNEKLKEIRKNKGMSTYKLAEILTNNGFKISQSAISKIENGQRKLDSNDLRIFAIALNIKTEMLLPDATEEDYERWNNDEDLKQAITLGNIPTDQLIEELNNRNDFPMKLKLK